MREIYNKKDKKDNHNKTIENQNIKNQRDNPEN